MNCDVLPCFVLCLGFHSMQKDNQSCWCFLCRIACFAMLISFSLSLHQNLVNYLRANQSPIVGRLRKVGTHIPNTIKLPVQVARLSCDKFQKYTTTQLKVDIERVYSGLSEIDQVSIYLVLIFQTAATKYFPCPIQVIHGVAPMLLCLCGWNCSRKGKESSK